MTTAALAKVVAVKTNTHTKDKPTMTTTLLTDLTVADICDGFIYNELEGKGLFGWGGKLVI